MPTRSGQKYHERQYEIETKRAPPNVLITFTIVDILSQNFNQFIFNLFCMSCWNINFVALQLKVQYIGLERNRSRIAIFACEEHCQ